MLVLGTCAIVAGLSLHIAELEIEKTTGDQQVDLLSAAAAYLDGDLAIKRTLLKKVAESVDGSVPGPFGRIQADNERYSMSRDEFANVVAYDDTGLLIADLHNRKLIGSQRFQERAYFQNTIKNR